MLWLPLTDYKDAARAILGGKLITYFFNPVWGCRSVKEYWAGTASV